MIDLLPSDAIDQLKHYLSEKRFEHCLGVMKTAFELADAWSQYDIDRTHLAWAALFHDCAKELNPNQRSALPTNGRVVYGKELMRLPTLVHAPHGALMLKETFSVDAYDVLMAVAYHPTGHPNLTPMGWIVYIADYLEPGRSYFDFREDFLAAAKNDPLEGAIRVSNSKIKTVQDKGRLVHPIAYEVKTYLDSLEKL